ncbi:hypothetical protein RND81_05G090700 [Saponaria officinalis]|uniref:Oligosaccharyltransferase complex subunit ostc n=1 Tax=Saponaria officinalis TaxID=3572 RepID=A0AAW1KWE1_SAPOF
MNLVVVVGVAGGSGRNRQGGGAPAVGVVGAPVDGGSGGRRRWWAPVGGAETIKPAATDDATTKSSDPILHLLRILPFSVLRPPRLRLKLQTLTLLTPITTLSFLLLTYFLVVSGVVYDVIVEPPGIGSMQDPSTGAVRLVVFLSGRVNGQYIIEGLSYGFMFFLTGLGIILMDLSLDKNRDKNVCVSYGVTDVSALVIGYVMSMLFIRIMIPGYLR